jgi:hypothetical protein
VGLAARGARNMDSDVETIMDVAVRDRLQAQARSVRLQSAVAALALLVVVMILPG